MSTAPIPPTAPYSCPKCGFEMNRAVQYCPSCGAQLARGMPYAGCFIALLVALSVPSALAGACFIAVGATVTPNNELGFDRTVMILIGLAILGFAALCVWGIVTLVRKRRGN